MTGIAEAAKSRTPLLVLAADLDHDVDHDHVDDHADAAEGGDQSKRFRQGLADC